MTSRPIAHPASRLLPALVLAGIALSAFNLRTAVTSLTPLLDVLGTVFGFGSTTAGLLGMLPTAAFAVFGVVTPALIRRIGLERTALLAMSLAGGGLVLRSLADSVGVLGLGAAIALAGMGIGNVVLPPLVKRWFPTRVGAISTLYITVLQLGTMLPALLAVPLADATSWRFALGIWSLTAFVAAVPWLWLLLRHREALAPPAPIVDPHAVAASAGRAWRSPIAWGMALMFGMTSLITYAMFTWLPLLLTEAGASPAFGGTMVALFSTLGLLGALGMPSIAVRMRNPFVIVLLCACCHLTAFAGLLFAPMAAPVLWVILLGLGPSTFPLALTLINLRTRTPVGSAALSGFMQGTGYALSCAGPLLFGVLHDATRGWHWPFAMLAVAVAVLVVGGWLACRPRWLEDTW
ncbi:MFS transporter [Luteimonas sp. 3794]|uniref:CynX/NimT family MFS transporter n=1 Tax=Luteimonas sp. 3794 TaxID=2817730 RepID=UPI00285D4218|nr:MFS transporter [Luteimonas sp. 3794]MDR6992391.1 CP family cyanate transporter-like MFS transporter [Luteimonas sp. 3794]